MAIDIEKLTLKQASEMLHKGTITSVELTEMFIEHAKEVNEKYNAYIELFDDAVEQAIEADATLKKNKKKAHPLCGIPIAIKDNILIEGRSCTSASKILDGHVAIYDATVIKKLKEAGVVFLGRTNMDEFAMGASTETSYYGPTVNPRGKDRVPGGSSGGSASAVAMYGALAALGSDTGGSIRQPGSFCGVVGLKPTYGAVSRYGLMAMASSLDQIGPLAHTVEDAELLYDTIVGYDSMDSTSISPEVRKELAPKAKKSYTIGVPADFVYAEGVDAEVIKNFKDGIKSLEDAGHTIKEVSIPNIEASLSVYYIIMPAEASTNLARFDGVRFGLHVDGKDLMEDYQKTRGEGFGKEVRRRIMLGTYVLSSGYYDAYYNKAISVRNQIKKGFMEAFEDVDAIAMPTAPTPAFKIGEKTADPLQMYLADIFTVPANLVGLPGISVPFGEAKEGDELLPTGFQLLASHMHEEVLFALGKDLENKR